MEYKISFDWFEKRLDSLKPYTSKQEKEVLLLEDKKSFTEFLEILSDIKPLNEFEAAALLVKLREISVSDLLELTQECDVCNFINPINIEINEFFNLEQKYEFPLGIFENVYDIINTKIADEIILKDFNKLEKNILKQSQNIFNPTVIRKCVRCGKDISVTINPKSILSKSNISSIFKEYLDLSYFTSNSKSDIDTMYPFERELYLNILNKRLKEDNKLNDSLKG